MENAVELSEFIWQLRSELTRASLTGEGKEIRFTAESVELELTVGVEKSRDPGARMKLWVFELGGSLKRSESVTQKVKLTLRPVSGSDPTQPALVGGVAAPGELR